MAFDQTDKGDKIFCYPEQLKWSVILSSESPFKNNFNDDFEQFGTLLITKCRPMANVQI